MKNRFETKSKQGKLEEGFYPGGGVQPDAFGGLQVDGLITGGAYIAAAYGNSVVSVYELNT